MLTAVKKWFQDPFFWALYAAERSGETYELNKLFENRWS